MSFFNYLILIISISSVCLSNVKGVKVSKEPFSFQKKNTDLLTSSQNKDLKIELIQLEDDFKSDYNSFKGNAYGLANTLTQTANLKPKIINTIDGGIIVPSEPDAQIVPIARF